MNGYFASTILAFSIATAHAATFTVTNTNDSGAGSLRDRIALANASPGADTITFDPGVTGKIVLTSGWIQITDALTINGPGAGILTIDGNASNRIFVVEEAAPPACPALTGPINYPVSISGLTLANAHRNTDNTGGAIWSGHDLIIDSVVIRDNAAKAGAGISFLTQYPGQSLTITNSAFVANLATPLSVVTSNQQGGALRIAENCGSGTINTAIPVTVTIANSLFAGNGVQPVALSGQGGAIWSFAYADITITNSRIVANYVAAPNPPVVNEIYQGGAFRGYAKSLTITRSEISDNGVFDVTGSDQTRGGGLFVVNGDPGLQLPADAMAVKIIDSTISGNSVSATAGAMLINHNVAVELDNTTISNNSAAANRTGGIIVSTATTATPTLKMVSSILANSAATTADLAGNATTIPTFTVDATNSLIETICTPSATCSTISVAGSGNQTATDPMLDPLGFNGGLTRTHPVLAGSPVINAGSNPLALATDQRGFARVFGAAADMGAYELISLPARLLVPDGTSVKQTFGAYPDTKWFAFGVEPGKTYAIEAADVDGDLNANAIGTLGIFDVDGASAPPEANVDCTGANGPRPPAVAVMSDGIRCVLRTAPATAGGTFLNKRPVYVKVTRMDPASGGGSQFKIRAREATIYGRWLTSGFDYHIEVENTTGNAMCVEVIGYPASGLTYNAAGLWTGSAGGITMTVPAFGAVKYVTPSGTTVHGDMEGTFRIGACSSPVNLIPGALHVSSYAFNVAASKYIYFFTTTANDGKTRSTW